MASELQDTLDRIINKSNILIEKYRVLSGEKEELEVKLELVKEDNERLRKENEALRQDNEYMKMARAVAPDPEKAAQVRSMISTLVRDIDRCINQLNE